jgi:hypothetical protein
MNNTVNGLADFDEEFDAEDLDDDLENESLFIAELDDALREKLTDTPWTSRFATLSEETPWEERVQLYQALRDGKALPDDATFFLIAWAIESLIEERLFAMYDNVYAKRFEQIRRAHGLAEDENWEPGEGPREYQDLYTEMETASHALARAAYQRFGEERMLDLLKQQPEQADRQYEAGHAYLEKMINESMLRKYTE